MNEQHELFDFLESSSIGLANEYQRIQKRASEDPGTAGDQGEENWAQILREWLPPTYQIVTKGRILSEKGVAGPQVDVLVLQPTYPRYLLDKKLYLAAGIAATFECKITLIAAHITEAIANAAVIRRLLPTRTGTPYLELNSPIAYGLLAHSHSWKSSGSTPIQNIDNKLRNVDRAVTAHPREMLDLVCVADLATWVLHKGLYRPPSFDSVDSTYFALGRGSDPDNPKVKPMGALLYALFLKLAHNDTSMRPLAEYFDDVEIAGYGAGLSERWPLTVYSEEVRNRIITDGQALWDGRLTRGRWDEWGSHF